MSKDYLLQVDIFNYDWTTPTKTYVIIMVLINNDYTKCKKFNAAAGFKDTWPVVRL